MADPNQTPQMGNWKCPCNGCKKAAKQVIDKIIEDYKTCSNIIDIEGHVYCYTHYKHEDCVRLMNLLFNITNDSKYTLPEIRQEVIDAVNEMLTDPNTSEILKRLKD
jgi:hypothetical protein